MIFSINQQLNVAQQMQIKSFPSRYPWSETDMQMKHQYNTIKAVTETHTRYSGSSEEE